MKTMSACRENETNRSYSRWENLSTEDMLVLVVKPHAGSPLLEDLGDAVPRHRIKDRENIYDNYSNVSSCILFGSSTKGIRNLGIAANVEHGNERTGRPNE